MGGCIVHGKEQPYVSKNPSKNSLDNSPIKLKGLNVVTVNPNINATKDTHSLIGSTKLNTPVKLNLSIKEETKESKFKIVLVQNNEIVIKFEVNNNEIQCPIWVEKSQMLRFEVNGKWALNKQDGYCNSEGYTGNIGYHHNKKLFRNFPIGALLGRILGGSYFVIKNNLQIKSDSYGPLYICTNTDDHYNDTEGVLEIKILGGNQTETEKLDEKLGWKKEQTTPTSTSANSITYIDTEVAYNYINDEEKLHLNLINKLRINPELFANVYLKHLVSKDSTHKHELKNGKFTELYNYIKTLQPVKPLALNKYLISLNKIQVEYLGSTGTTGNLTINGDLFKNELSKCNIPLEGVKYGESLSYGNFSALDNIIYLLIDLYNRNKINRANLLNRDFTSIGIAMNSHIIYHRCWIITYLGDLNEIKSNKERISDNI